MDIGTAFSLLSFRSVITATVVSYFFMALWYSPFLFGQRWVKESHITRKMLRKRDTLSVYAATLIMNFLAALLLGMFITVNPTLKYGLLFGFSVGFFWIAMFISIIYTFERRPLPLYFIDAGYVICACTMMGGILGGWNRFF